VSIGSPLDARTQPLNRKREWRDWSGYYAASQYDYLHIHEYVGIRHAAVLIDVSPLYKYAIRGRDAVALVDRVITRDATKIKPGQVIYTPWCDEHGKVVDDGTVARLDDDTFRWTSAEPHVRWLNLNARGLDVEVADVSERFGAIALQGPLARDVLNAATATEFADLRFYHRRSARIGSIPVDVSRTGYTGDLGYELWFDAAQATKVWDCLLDVGRPYALRPAGMMALDMARLEAGLILIEVDYTSSKHALIPGQNYSPFEIGLGRLVNLDKSADFVGRRALEAEVASGGPARRLVGLHIDYQEVEALYEAQDLPIAVTTSTWREQRPVYSGRPQIGRATSGTWSPTLKQHIALASVQPEFESAGAAVELEWTVEGRRGRVAAKVVPLPFFDPPRKRA
jgi:aminomethyltransferase